MMLTNQILEENEMMLPSDLEDEPSTKINIYYDCTSHFWRFNYAMFFSSTTSQDSNRQLRINTVENKAESEVARKSFCALL